MLAKKNQHIFSFKKIGTILKKMILSYYVLIKTKLGFLAESAVNYQRKRMEETNHEKLKKKPVFIL